MGLPKDAKIEIDTNQLVLQSSRIVGSSLGTRAEAKRALTFVVLGKVKVEKVIRPLADIAEIFKELQGGKVSTQSWLFSRKADRGKIKGRVVVKLFDE